jgi:uncharacterized protein involved in exopolysaccharide biosynthesis
MVFLVVFACGCLYTLLQDSIWRSTATVLVSAPVALGEIVERSDPQAVAIQSRRLLGLEVTTALSERLLEEQGIELTPAELDDMLSVTAVDDTNLVELSAVGTDRDALPGLVNSWIDVYIAMRAEDVARLKVDTLQQVDDKQLALQTRLRQARDALDMYRRENDIVSAQREENAVLAELDGLNQAFNEAIAEEVRAAAYLETLRLAVRRGERFVPKEQEREVQNLQRELERLQAEMVELESRYTQQYINKNFELRSKVERIDELQLELDRAYASGREAELAAARQAHAAAKQAVKDLRDKLSRQRERVAGFTRIYETHEALRADLARLEELNREAQTREVEVSIQDLEKYPQVDVIQRPPEFSEHVGPDYRLLLGGSFGLAFLLGLLSVWLQSFLGSRSPSPTYLSVSIVPPESAATNALEYEERMEAARMLTGKGPGRNSDDQD